MEIVFLRTLVIVTSSMDILPECNVIFLQDLAIIFLKPYLTAFRLYLILLQKSLSETKFC